MLTWTTIKFTQSRDQARRHCWPNPQELLLLKSRGAGNDLDEFRRDRCLARAIVQQSELAEHVLCILCRVLHRLHPRTELRSAVLKQRVVHDCTKFEFCKVQEKFGSVRTLQFVLVKTIFPTFRYFLVSLCRKHSCDCWLERNNWLKSVVDDLILMSPVWQDFVCDQRSCWKAQRHLRDIKNDILQVVRKCFWKLTSRLFPYDSEWSISPCWTGNSFRDFHHGWVDSSAKPFVRRYRNKHCCVRRETCSTVVWGVELSSKKRIYSSHLGHRLTAEKEAGRVLGTFPSSFALLSDERQQPSSSQRWFSVCCPRISCAELQPARKQSVTPLA